ncbi:MAG: ChaN family lipoprotein [Rhodocyclaceae bacterium]|nr:ChaN family lipoprotein [Rhodocyclaceae bacterium]
MKRSIGSWGTALLFAASLAACAAAGEEPWRTTQLREHPLVGHIWDVAAARAITRNELVARLMQARIVLLGETHDNEDHHQLQAAIHGALTAQGKRPALVMEQFDLEHQPAIDAARSTPGATARSVAAAGRMREGWNFDFYAPLLAQALETGTPIVAANLSRDAARAVMREGFAALGPDRARALALEQVWDAGREARLRHDIVEGHCGQVPDDLLPGLVAAQRARDALMADAILAHAGRGVVGIIGRGHARHDLGVPRYVAQRSAQTAVAAVGMVEVESSRLRAEDYAADLAQFDYLWFTPRAQRKDPCSGFSMPARR